MKHTVHVNEVSNERRSEDAVVSLATVLEKFGGYEFDFELADGSRAPVSLASLRGKDPASTFVTIAVESKAETKKEYEQFEAAASARHDR
ncbi:hypothetical protein [Calidifontibacter indicus]|uniref:hypothetical protein n=1 Tax=Calidifontibacter indicus TaxID=419650 RepID=UPI003D735985